MTMLGGVLATVAALFVTARLPARRPVLYDREIADGKILVGVRSPSDASLSAVERVLKTAGAADVRTIA
jgi:Protein of unknown function (DUF3341)